jgi:hypothetical protein
MRRLRKLACAAGVFVWAARAFTHFSNSVLPRDDAVVPAWRHLGANCDDLFAHHWRLPMLINLRKIWTTGLAAIALGAVLSVLLPKAPHHGVAIAGPATLGATEIVREDSHVSELMKIDPAELAAPSVCGLPPLTDDDLD